MRSRTIRILLMGLVLGLALPTAANGAVLYDQTNFASANDIESDDFNGDIVDDQVADDFTVPLGQRWQLSGVDVFGSFAGMPPASVHAFLYLDSGTLPGTELFRQLSIPSSGGPNYAVPLTGAPVLKAGSYWVSIQQAGATFMLPAWYWTLRAVQSGDPAAFRRPSSPPGPCAPNWGTRTACNVSTEPDQIFRLSGTATSEPVTFGKLKANKTKGTAELTVNVPGPGTLDLAGAGLATRHLARRTSGARTSVQAAGPVTLLIKAKGKARKKLNTSGKVRLTAAITYTATGATPSVQTKKVKLRKR